MNIFFLNLGIVFIRKFTRKYVLKLGNFIKNSHVNLLTHEHCQSPCLISHKHALYYIQFVNKMLYLYMVCINMFPWSCAFALFSGHFQHAIEFSCAMNFS